MTLAVYTLSLLTALLCSVLLARGYRRTRVRLLFWASVCFASLALENLILIVNDFVPQDLSLVRLVPPLVGLAAMIYGLIWESR
jgi:hypothetical protein